MNLRPSGYEPDELPCCSTPRHVKKTIACSLEGVKAFSQRIANRFHHFFVVAFVGRNVWVFLWRELSWGLAVAGHIGFAVGGKHGEDGIGHAAGGDRSEAGRACAACVAVAGLAVEVGRNGEIGRASCRERVLRLV